MGAGMQGWLRRVRDDGLVEPAPLEEAAEVRELPPLDVAIISELDHPDGEAVVQSRVASGGTAAITRGARGATLFSGGKRLEIPAAPAREVDPTGAGDVFGVVLTRSSRPGGRSPSQAEPPPRPPRASSRALASEPSPRRRGAS